MNVKKEAKKEEDGFLRGMDRSCEIAGSDDRGAALILRQKKHAGRATARPA
jgi:hypothetical protein